MENKNLLISIDGERRDDMSDAQAELLLARATWLMITEPGDQAAGAIIREYGPIVALQIALNPESRFNRNFCRWQDRNPGEQRISEMLVAAAKDGQRLLIPEHHSWPHELHDLRDTMPHGLWVRGDLDVLRRTKLAVAGSRASTAYGAHVTAELVSAFAQHRVTVVAGGAHSIDGAAHRAAIAVGLPTIAVQASALDRPYPQGHSDLLRTIPERGGLVLSELAPGSAPTRWRFQQRGRLIAALSRALIIPEAGARSSAIRVAHMARDLDRAVFAVPGPITSSASIGCHALIRGHVAELVTGPEDLKRIALFPSETKEQ